MQPRILARPVEIELVMRVLHRRDLQAATDQNRDHLGDQRGLAGTAPSGETDNAHGITHCGYDKDGLRILRLSLMAEKTQKQMDLRGLKCPLPVLRTRKALAAMTAGEILIVACSDPLAGIDIPTLLSQTGDTLETTDKDANVITFRIRKT
jgi:tRNA 2-thiouridine synthesizing protein A